MKDEARIVSFHQLKFIVSQKDKVCGFWHGKLYQSRKDFNAPLEKMALQLEDRIHANGLRKRILGENGE